MLAGSGFESLSSKLALSKNGSQIGWSSHMCTHICVYIYNTFPIKMAYIGHILGVNSAVFIGPRLLQVKPLGIIGSLRRGHRKKRPKVARKETLSNWSHRSWKSSETPKRSVKKSKLGTIWLEHEHPEPILTTRYEAFDSPYITVWGSRRVSQFFMARLYRRIEFALPHWQEKTRFLCICFVTTTDHALL